MANSEPEIPRGPTRRYLKTFTDSRGRQRHYFQMRKVKVPLPGKPGTSAFEAAYSRAVSRWSDQKRPIGRGVFERAVRAAVGKARIRAKLRGLPCTITTEWVFDQLERQGYRCALTRIIFRPTSGPGTNWKKNPYALSLDRIDREHGYVPGNVRIVLLAVNIAINEWGLEVLAEIAVALRLTGSAGRPTPETA